MGSSADTEMCFQRSDRRVCETLMHDGISQTFRFEAGEDEDEIVVEVGILIQLLQFLMRVRKTTISTDSKERRDLISDHRCVLICTHSFNNSYVL